MNRYHRALPGMALGHFLSCVAIIILLVHGAVHHSGLTGFDACHSDCVCTADHPTPPQPGGHEQDHNGAKAPLDQGCPLCIALAGGGINTPEPPLTLCELQATEAAIKLPQSPPYYSNDLAYSISPRGPPLVSP